MIKLLNLLATLLNLLPTRDDIRNFFQDLREMFADWFEGGILLKEFSKTISRGIRAYRKALLTVLLIIVVAVVAVGIASLIITSSPGFCKTCHFMEPYYERWKTSTHNQVKCVKCHVPPGIKGYIKGKIDGFVELVKYVTFNYSKPKAEIDDVACLRSGCHQEARLIGHQVSYKRNISFEHGKHLGVLRNKMKLRCTSCHSQIVQGEHITVTESVCFTCHFKEIELGKGIADCGLCHGAPKKEVEHEGIRFNHQEYLENKVDCLTCHVDIVRGEGEVPQQRCFSCHAEPERLARYGETEFMHINHVTDHKVECFECHQNIEHSLEVMAPTITLECGQCHQQRHTISEEMYMGIGGKGVVNIPSAMFKAKVDCNGCHRYPRAQKLGEVAESVQLAKPDACDICHGQGTGEMMVPMWQESIKGAHAEVEAELRKMGAKIRQAKAVGVSSKRIDQASQLYRDAEQNAQFVKADGSWGVHNFEYADALLSKSREYLEQAGKILRGEEK